MRGALKTLSTTKHLLLVHLKNKEGIYSGRYSYLHLPYLPWKINLFLEVRQVELPLVYGVVVPYFSGTADINLPVTNLWMNISLSPYNDTILLCKVLGPMSWFKNKKLHLKFRLEQRKRTRMEIYKLERFLGVDKLSSVQFLSEHRCLPICFVGNVA